MCPWWRGKPTDDKGARTKNMPLSNARADSVKIYLVAKGLPAELISTTGMGPNQPIMSNATTENRKRNRHIEFRVSQ
jgi:OmpA-OmpF porin, OOP family